LASFGFHLPKQLPTRGHKAFLLNNRGFEGSSFTTAITGAQMSDSKKTLNFKETNTFGAQLAQQIEYA
jgi:hypothetical protein